MKNWVLHIKKSAAYPARVKGKWPMIVYFLKKGNKKIQKFVLSFYAFTR